MKKMTFSDLAKKHNMSMADYAKFCMGGSAQKRAEGGTIDDVDVVDEDTPFPKKRDEYYAKVYEPKKTGYTPSKGEMDYYKKVSPKNNAVSKKQSVPSLYDQLQFNTPQIDPENPEGNNEIVPSKNGVQANNTPVDKDIFDKENPDFYKGINPATGISYNPSNQSTPTKSNTKAGFDYGSAIGLGQGILGGYLLSKNKRPIDSLTPEFQSQLAASIAQSKYGYTPEQKSLLNEQLIENRNNELQNVYNASGGNGSVALNNVRQVFNDNYKDRLENASKDELLRLQKMNTANQMASEGEGYHRQLFGDKMNQYNQNVNAGAQLLGAGMENLIGSQRYGQSKLAQQQADKYNYGS